jgi:hypothetical protein
VEFYLALHQAIHDVMTGMFPITQREAVHLAALRAQNAMGPFSRLNLGHGKYKVRSGSLLPSQPTSLYLSHSLIGKAFAK